MKFIVSLLIIALIVGLVYKFTRKAIKLTIGAAIILLALLAFVMYRSATAPDTWCTTSHKASTQSPAKLKTAGDYLALGDHDYETGNCQKALADYSIAITLSPNYSQALNNRAYTYMRLRNYQAALTDLDAALILNPDYIQALMNRGDIYNYYLVDRPKAITDYEHVLSVQGASGTSVCGHLFLAVHNGWNLGTILDLPQFVINYCR